jgi:hypothetical protein
MSYNTATVLDFDDEHEPDLAKAGGCEQLDVSRGEVGLCMILNHRTKAMRVIDFRAGSQANKFELIRDTALKHGMERAFTVVEREESTTWAKMGFDKEGSIPGFYKRSDAYILGIDIEAPPAARSGTRIKISGAPVTEKSTADRAERAYQASRRFLRNGSEPLPKVNVAEARDQDIEKAFSHAEKTGRVLTEMENFGRGVEKTQFLCTARGGFSLLVGVEAQPCFDNAMIDALCAPRGDKETLLTAAALSKICQQLLSEGIVSAFALSPVESVELSAAYLKVGFKRTGVLPNHLRVNGQKADAFLWSRRLADPE